MVQLFYITYISVDLAYHEIFCSKVGKGGIKIDTVIKRTVSFGLKVLKDETGKDGTAINTAIILFILQLNYCRILVLQF